MDYYHHLWAVIHLSALRFKKGESDEAEYEKFYKSISYTMNCSKCVRHFEEYIENNPIDFDNLFNWTVDLHNDVNRTRGAPTYTYEETLKYWS